MGTEFRPAQSAQIALTDRRLHQIEQAISAGYELAKKAKRHLLAPLRAVEAIAASMFLPFEEGCALEQRLFEESVTSPQCRASIHGFFAERAVSRIPGLETAPSSPISRVGLVGAGTMGTGIAMACANAGPDVLLKDSRPEAIEAGMSTILRHYETSIKKGRFTQEDVKQRFARIVPQVPTICVCVRILRIVEVDLQFPISAWHPTNGTLI